MLVKDIVLECLLLKCKQLNTFGDDVCRQSVDDYFGLNFDSSYAQSYTGPEAADHVYGFMCAKAQAGLGESFGFSRETEFMSFYFCTGADDCQLSTERRIENYITRYVKSDYAVSIRSYQSQQSVGQIVLFVVEILPFINPKPAPGEDRLEQLTTEKFLTLRTSDSQTKYANALKLLADSITPVYTIVPLNSDGSKLALKMAFKEPDRLSYFTGLTTLLSTVPNVVMYKKFMETFSNKAQVYTFYLDHVTQEQVRQAAVKIGMLPHRPERPTTKLYDAKVINAQEVVYANTLITFAFYFTPPPLTDDYLELGREVRHHSVSVQRLKNLRNGYFRDIMTEEFCADLLKSNVGLLKLLFEDFSQGTTLKSADKLTSLLDNALRLRSPLERDVFKTFLLFNKSVMRTNFFKVGKAAVCYRLNPNFVAKLDFPLVPFGIFMFIGSQFRGFHVRFTDIARGGVRLISSPAGAYKRNKSTLFQENYNLSYAQLLKNKDIPEGGSKGTILVSHAATADFKTLFLQYIDALLDVLIPGTSGIRYSPMLTKEQRETNEIIFLGPDENTAGQFPTIAAFHAKARGYKQWKSFTTGKSQTLGGIPHDLYGMTSQGVRQNAKCLYDKLEVKEEMLTKFQTAGPDGDLGSNEILLGNEIWVGLCDGSGSLHDPDGVNKQELVRLAKERKALIHFDKSKFSSRGFFVGVAEKNVKLPDGTLVEDGILFRNTFHFTKYAKADIFVPCGGRPATVNLGNVHKWILDPSNPNLTGQGMLEGKVAKESLIKNDQLMFRYIVEGANLFITHDARLALESVGVKLIKDSTANKGGVTCSSFEVLAGLALSESEHSQHMGVQPGKPIPEFYKNFVAEIIDRIHSNSKREFECMWSASQNGQYEGKFTLISDALSQRIVQLRRFITESNLYDKNPRLVNYVINQYTPSTLLNLVPIETFKSRVPLPYQQAMFAIWVASDFVYSVGMDGNEFSFFEYMNTLGLKMSNGSKL